MAREKENSIALDNASAINNMNDTKGILDREPKVKIRLHKDKNNKEDVFVAINGMGYLIKRGETVEVPESIAAIIDQSQAQDSATADMIDELTKTANKM